MPKREDEFWAAQKEGRGRGLCPFCGSSNIYYNRPYKSWKCAKCEKSFPSPSYGPGGDFGREARWFGKTTEGERRKEFAEAACRKRESESGDKHPTSNIHPEPAKPKASNPGKKVVNRPIQNWLWALLLIFALSIISLGISIYIGSFIPFWLSLGFSCIYSVEKWFSYTTRKHKVIGKLYRLLLNLCILSLFGFLIWSGIKLFSQELSSSPLFSSLIFLAEFVFFIWMWRVVARNSWRFPSMKLTISSLIGLFLVLAFAGVQPASSYKDQAFGSISSWFSSISRPATSTPTVTAPTPTATKPTPTLPSSPTKPPALQREELVQYALDLINADRANNGLTSVTLGNNIAAQKHAEEMLVNDYLSHWGMDGLKPYMRYTLAGGFNYEAENGFMSYTVWYGGKDLSYQRDAKAMLDEAEKNLMSSPGHRRNIVNKWHKKINLGIAYDNERLALVQQFEGDYITFTKLPVLEGGILSLSGETLAGLVFEQIQIFYDQLPHSLTLGQLGKTYAYGLGRPSAFIRPLPPPGSYYLESEALYSWETYVDPYTVPPDTPPSPPSSSFSIKIPPVPLLARETVKWVDARRWDVLGSSFAIETDLNEVVLIFGKGVYTVVIWGEIGGESVNVSNYSIFVQ